MWYEPINLKFQNVLFLSSICTFRAEGKKFGYAESLPVNRITANREEPKDVDTTEAMETAQQVIEAAESPQKVYPFLS